MTPPSPNPSIPQPRPRLPPPVRLSPLFSWLSPPGSLLPSPGHWPPPDADDHQGVALKGVGMEELACYHPRSRRHRNPTTVTSQGRLHGHRQPSLPLAVSPATDPCCCHEYTLRPHTPRRTPRAADCDQARHRLHTPDAVFKGANGRCRICGGLVSDLSIDWSVPQSQVSCDGKY